MGEKKFDGAFPYGFNDVSQYQHFQAGLSIRQFYKAAALTGLLARAMPGGPGWLAKEAGSLADAMIAEDDEAAKP